MGIIYPGIDDCYFNPGAPLFDGGVGISSTYVGHPPGICIFLVWGRIFSSPKNCIVLYVGYFLIFLQFSISSSGIVADMALMR